MWTLLGFATFSVSVFSGAIFYEWSGASFIGLMSGMVILSLMLGACIEASHSKK